MPFDWTAIIDRNRADLARLVGVLFGMAGVTARYMPLRVSREVWLGVLRMLRPAESALRRLIVIAARGLVVPVRAPRAMPEGGIASGAGARRLGSFALFDPRRPLPIGPEGGGRQVAGSGPQIRSFDEGFSAFASRATVEDIEAAALMRRLARLQRALERLPQEARRLARWRVRHPTMLKRPMRPGRPPGQQERAKDDLAQEVLRETQIIALWAMAPGNP